MKLPSRIFLRIAMLAAVAQSCTFVGSAHAADAAAAFPVRPVRMIIPFAPGGGSDIVGRVLAQGLGETWGQAVIADNRPGAGSTIGAAIAARAPADGYTTMVSSSAIAFSPSLYKGLSYDAARDFAPISLLARQPSLLAVATTVSARSVKELIEGARTRPDGLNFGSAGVGSATHLGGELFRHSAGITMTHVPYKSAGLAMNALLAGEIKMLLTNTATVIPHVRAGRVRALGISGKNRSPLAPEIPTVAEGGLPGFEYDTWYAMLAPAGVARSVINRYSADTASVLRDSKHGGRLASLGVEVVASTPEVLSDYLRAELKKWSQVIKAAALTPQ